jgi:hypothetical protein
LYVGTVSGSSVSCFSINMFELWTHWSSEYSLPSNKMMEDWSNRGQKVFVTQ